MKRIIATDDAPAAVGAYSQATTNGDILITAGQLPLTTDGDLLDDESVADQTGQCLRNVDDLLDDESVADQTGQCLRNVEAILESEGLSLSDVLKTTVFLDDIDDFDEFNQAYSEFFDAEPPARSAVGVGAVPKGAAVEIEAIATTE